MVLSFVNRQADLVHRALAAIQQQYVAGSLDLDLRDPRSLPYVVRVHHAASPAPCQFR
jgi:hypothetical protein